MCAKVTLTKNVGIKTRYIQNGLPILTTELRREKKVMAQEKWQISILHPKTSKEFYQYIKLRKSIIKRRCSIKKAALKHFAIFTGKHLCWSIFLIKFIITKLQHRYFPVNIARFLRASILYNICERLFERFPTWTNITSHIESE